jgi:hypothetical protein
MTKRFKASLFVFFFTLLRFQTFASPQMPDYIIFKGDTLVTYNLILEQFFQKQQKADRGKLFGLSFHDGSSFNCWRAYQAIYKIDNDSLFLVDIIKCGELRNGKIDKAASAEKMTAIFNDKMVNGRVYISWFSGEINFPLNSKMLRWDGVFYKIYEREKVFSISIGKVLNIEDVENYVDDPRRINRRDKKEISEILFNKLKKTKWKTAENFDCSDEYLVTIDRNGNVSKVRMLNTDEEIEKYYEKDEYSFCINNMFNALKSLKFDIIKDKGKPMAEDIYIEIWVDDDGEIKN